MPQETRAYSVISIKSIDEDRRVFTGTATTPTPDRAGDIVDPMGVSFTNPLPLLLHHDMSLPVGEAVFHPPTPKGIDFTATIAKVDEPGPLKDRVDTAWQSVKARLMRGVSIRIMGTGEHVKPLKSGGLHWLKSEVPELSLVTIPMNREATIASIKSVDALDLAAPGEGRERNSPGVSGTPVVRLLPTRQERQMKSLQEQITSYKSTRDQKFSEMQGLMTTAAEGGVTLDASQGEQYETLEGEVKACDTHIKRLEALQEAQKSVAVPVVGTDPLAAHASRGGQVPASSPIIRVQPNEAPGIGFTRAIMCKAASFLAITKDGVMKSALDFAKERYPDNDRLHQHLKATINAGTTTDVSWAGPLVYATNLVDEFVEFLRPQTIIGKFGTNGIPGLTRTPFNVRVPRQTSGGDAYWVGQGAPKPLTKFDFDSITLLIAKVAAISVITEELARLSSPSAEMRVRDGLSGAVTQRIDTDFIDPTQAAVSGVNPASITNGVSALSPSGTTADAARSDVARLIKAFLDVNMDPSGLVLIMPTALALGLSVMRNSLGQAEFPGLTMAGGSFLGLPVITSQYAANSSGAGNLVIAVNAKDIFLADDGQITVDVSREASLQMLDNPTNATSPAVATSMVSMFQTNSLAIRAERFINWTKARSTAVVYMDDVNWGSIGSPA